MTKSTTTNLSIFGNRRRYDAQHALDLKRKRYITTWLKSLIIAVMLMVVVGGATRLTHSGLSMVQWQPLRVLPPLSKTDWLQEFTLYQQTPEYQQINQDMTLDGFKQIYWWEYAHRLLGRLIGILALIPLIWLSKSLPTWLSLRMIGIFALGGAQGIIGWWMVKSGLKDDPAVSHLRLSVHLIMAFAILALLSRALWRHQGLSLKKIYTKDWILLGALSLTIIYGGLVAGLKAGLIYNSFPLMEGQLLPSEWNFYTPLWLNFINNAAMVQWCHRILALGILGYVIIQWQIHGVAYRTLAIALIMQVCLGIVILLWQIPLILALFHQTLAMIVWLIALKAFTTVTIKQVAELADVKTRSYLR